MYKQKSWNIENLHTGFIKAFIFVSMLFVCMASVKMSVRAERFTYVISNAGTHSHVWKDYEDNYVMTETFTLSDDTYYYFWSKTSSTAYYLKRYNLLDNTLSNVGTITIYKHQEYNDGKVSDYSSEATRHWRNNFCFEEKFVSTTLPVFDSDKSAINYIETGNTSGLLQSSVIEPSFGLGEKYDTTYMFIGFDCGEMFDATWNGVTNRSIELGPVNVTEKVQVRVAYENDGYQYKTLAVLDTSEKRWAELKDSVIEKCDGVPRYLEFTPFYYTSDNKIYYGKSVQYDISPKHGGSGHIHGDSEDGNVYVSSGINASQDNTLGYLQGVKRQLVYDVAATGYVVTWDTSNSELNNCRVEVVLRFMQQKLKGDKMYMTVPYIEYDNAVTYTTGFYEFNYHDLMNYYKETYYNSNFSIGYNVDKIFLRLVRYDAVNDSYEYGGFVSIDSKMINSDGIYTTDLQNGGTDKVDTDSEDSYSVTTGGIFGSNDIYSRDAVGSSITNIISSLDSTQRFLGSGSFDAFLKSSFSFIPSEIWTIIMSGISVVVGFLFIKLILKVL